MTNALDPRPFVGEGVYFDMDESEYHAAAGLSNSGMKHLLVSPLHYWHCNLNPERQPRKETAALRFGKAAHCLGLEPDRFAARYALRLKPDDFPGALVTTDDMKAFLAEHGLPKSAKRKQDLIERIAESGVPAVIWDEELVRHAERNAGKTLLGEDESELIQRAAGVIAADPYASALLTGGLAEVSFFVRDPASGVLLKARMDYVRANATIDLKTFSNSRGKPTDRAVFEAVYYEGYFQQAVFYHKVRELARQQLAAGEIAIHGPQSALLAEFLAAETHGFGFVFIESCEPFDLRILQLVEAEAAGGQQNIYWQSGERRIDDLIELYARCVRKFGDRPWREPQKPRVFLDTDVPQLIFS